MNEDVVISALNGMDAENVESFIKLHEKYTAKRKSVLRRIAAGAVAAAAVAISVAGIVSANIKPHADGFIRLTAEEAAAVFPQAMGTPTNQYQMLTLPQKADFPAVTQSESLPVYRLSDSNITRSDVEAFAEKHVPAAARFCGIKNTDYTVYEDDFDSETYYDIRFADKGNGEEYNAQINFINSYNTMWLTMRGNSRSGWRVHVNGDFVCVDMNGTDEEIAAELQSAVAYLQEAFGTQYKDIKINRYEDSMHVYVYDASAAYDPPFGTSGEPFCPGFLSLYFHNNSVSAYSWEGGSSDAYLITVEISESQNSWRGQFEIVGEAKMLSLKEAERLLEKGYVFGGHSCPLCMSEQSPIDFSDYDAVKLEYVVEGGMFFAGKRIMPFYAFYKYQGEDEDGVKYARTYVPAIELTGMDEYFEKQKQFHNAHSSGWEQPAD